MALVYQNTRGSELRANLAVLFILGCTMSLTALALVGRFGLGDIQIAGVLMIGVVLGVACAKPLTRLVDKTTARPYLLGLCCLSALGVMGRAIFQGGA